jgi:hypothetical protein
LNPRLICMQSLMFFSTTLCYTLTSPMAMAGWRKRRRLIKPFCRVSRTSLEPEYITSSGPGLVPKRANVSAGSSPASRTGSRLNTLNPGHCTVDFTPQALPLGLQKFLRRLKLGD